LPADADPARLSKRLQSRCDIHRIAEDVIVVCNHIAEIDAGAQLDAVVRRGPRAALGHRLVDFDRAAHRIDNAGKFSLRGLIAGGRGRLSKPTTVV
jgi:hypothetical protein